MLNFRQIFALDRAGLSQPQTLRTRSCPVQARWAVSAVTQNQVVHFKMKKYLVIR